jgi:hypothetical protein
MKTMNAENSEGSVPVKKKILLWMTALTLALAGCALDGSTAEPRMHPSWDLNRDGINDCEDDGTCDDARDYTLPRTASARYLF